LRNADFSCRDGRSTAASSAVSRSFVARHGTAGQTLHAAWRKRAQTFSVRAQAMPMATAAGIGNAVPIARK
jgi:hypothetical protein